MSHHNDYCEIHQRNNCWCDKLPQEEQRRLMREFNESKKLLVPQLTTWQKEVIYLREAQAFKFYAVGERIGVSASRACQLYNQARARRDELDKLAITTCCPHCQKPITLVAS